jgi:hypothetical protein
MLSSPVLSETLIRTLATPPAFSHIRPPNAATALNPLESALTKNAPVTRLESADPKTKDLKSFRIRTYEKGGGRGPQALDI